MIARTPCRPPTAVFDQPTEKLSVHKLIRLYTETDQAGIGIASKCRRHERRNLADFSSLAECTSRSGKGISPQIACRVDHATIIATLWPLMCKNKSDAP